MDTRTVVESELSEIRNEWLFVRPIDKDGKEGDGYFVTTDDPESIRQGAKDLKMTPQAVRAMAEALEYMFETLREHLEVDLKDIWNKVS